MNLQRTHSYGSRRGGYPRSSEEKWTNGLGWFSIGLGAAEVLAPRTVARLIGLNGRGKPAVLRTSGLREIAAGIGILSQPQPVGWMWGRVAGDLMDLATLGSAARSDSTNRTRIAAATTAVLGVTALDVFYSRQLTRQTSLFGTDGRARIVRSIMVDRSPDEVYQFWHNFDNMRSILERVESARELDSTRSQWMLKTPLGKTLEWTAETIIDEPGKHIAWRSVGESDIEISGSVWFEKAPADRGTLVRVQIEYGPSIAALIGKAGKLFGAGAEDEVENMLRRFKQMIETGEIAKSDAGVRWGPHAAQPESQAA